MSDHDLYDEITILNNQLVKAMRDIKKKDAQLRHEIENRKAAELNLRALLNSVSDHIPLINKDIIIIEADVVRYEICSSMLPPCKKKLSHVCFIVEKTR